MALLNRSHVKALLLDRSAETRNGKFTRVSGEIFEWLEGEVRAKCQSAVRCAPSLGKTLYPPVRVAASAAEEGGGQKA